MILKFLAYLALGLGMIILSALIMAIPTYYLWNWLCPILFSFPVITLKQALGLNLLCGILFGSRGSISKKES